MHRSGLYLALMVFIPILNSGWGACLNAQDRSNPDARENNTGAPWMLEQAEKVQFDNLDSAIHYAEAGLQLAEESNDPRLRADASRLLGSFHMIKLNYQESVHYLDQSLELYKEIGDSMGVAHLLNTLGRLYHLAGEPGRALEYFQEAGELFRAHHYARGIANTTLNSGVMLDELNRTEEAMDHYFEATELLDSIQDLESLSATYLNIAEHYQEADSLELAEALFLKSLFYGEASDDPGCLADIYFYLGNFYFHTGDLPLAMTYLDSAMQSAQRIQSLENIMQIIRTRRQIFEKMGQADSALYYASLYEALNDSLKPVQLENQLRLMEWQSQRERERLEAAYQMSRQKLRTIFAMVALGLVGIILIILWRNYRMKQRANQVLAEIDRLKSRMFANISHEFRTPLTLIQGPVENLLKEGKEQRLSMQQARSIHRNASRLLSLVNQMLDLSKMDAGKMKLELVNAHPARFAYTVGRFFSSLAENKKIEFELEEPAADQEIAFDSDKVEKVLTNILSNAFKYTPTGGRVIMRIQYSQMQSAGKTLPVKKKVPCLDVSITDSGPGIPQKDLDKVFDRFYQVDPDSGDKIAGTGIGLALTYELVSLMHGQIKLRSRMGEGTSFRVIIPLGTEHLSESEYTRVSQKPAPENNQAALLVQDGWVPREEDAQTIMEDPETGDMPLLLIVEDEPEIRTYIRKHMPGYSFLEAPDGKKGFELTLEKIPDLVITDLMMPEIDGLEMCNQIKEHELTMHIPVVMLTAKAALEDRLEGLQRGADDYLSKPFNLKELQVRVDNLVEQRQKLRERFSREISLKPSEVAVTSADDRFLQKLLGIAEEQLGNAEFDVTGFAKEAHVSHVQLFRKLKALTGKSPSEFIRTLRLKRGMQLLESGFGNVAEVAYEVGFNNLSYFAKCFKEEFGKAPSSVKQKK